MLPVKSVNSLTEGSSVGFRKLIVSLCQSCSVAFALGSVFKKKIEL